MTTAILLPPTLKQTSILLTAAPRSLSQLFFFFSDTATKVDSSLAGCVMNWSHNLRVRANPLASGDKYELEKASHLIKLKRLTRNSNWLWTVCAHIKKAVSTTPLSQGRIPIRFHLSFQKRYLHLCENLNLTIRRFEKANQLIY